MLDERRDLQRALSQLSSKLREVVVLRYSGDLDLSEIAETLDIPWGTVKRRLYVETANAQRLHDTHPQLGQMIRLWLPAQRPAFVRRHDETAENLVQQATFARLDPNAGVKPTRTAKGAISLAFERELFSVPFGVGDVQSYQLASPVVVGEP